ncbi:MAG: hypothetical protein K2Z80_10015 [Xanthobacteraceae bacterium]|nr:hypothetical protein [Xanthobacteraceae bacterium]
MGYHFGIVTPEGGAGPQAVVVLNGQFALKPDEILNLQSFDRLRWDTGKEVYPGLVVTMISAPPLLRERSAMPSEDISLLEKSFGRFFANIRRFETHAVVHSSPPFQLATKPNEKFVRFSAFRNDRRIQSDGSLLPGSYATSELDARFSPSGFAVVGRYALPNILPAINRFEISVPPGTSGLVGTVSPAFGQAGGGVEIEFTNGAPPSSVIKHSTIPEY